MRVADPSHPNKARRGRTKGPARFRNGHDIPGLAWLDVAALKSLNQAQNDYVVAQWPHVDAGERDGCKHAHGTSGSL